LELAAFDRMCKKNDSNCTILLLMLQLLQRMGHVCGIVACKLQQVLNFMKIPLEADGGLLIQGSVALAVILFVDKREKTGPCTATH
jgi:hypothetical protein